MKGLEPIVAVVALIGVVMLSALIIYQWQGGFVQTYTNDIGDQTRMQLRCEKADISILNASFDCGSCNLSLKLKNSGLVDLNVLKIYATDKTGNIFEMNGTLFVIGDVKSISNKFANCASLKNSITEVRVLTECQGVGDFVRDVSYIGC